ncbi:hypothetical protein D9611_013728 [Ephemerocybe angulata]|uniref:P/Homo B domain-containing protein n=1 Tax=Ephemerocybe angulata TaxID=980116 RepID=A0A8H5BD11_9AGAR|nr:hypothetical protein D9611_013728 [Tulosesus angulatus]
MPKSWIPNSARVKLKDAMPEFVEAQRLGTPHLFLSKITANYFGWYTCYQEELDEKRRDREAKLAEDIVAGKKKKRADDKKKSADSDDEDGGEAPEPDTMDDTAWRKTRTKSIRGWFYNNHPNRKKDVQCKFTFASAPVRTLTEYQLYSKKYYEERIKPRVEKALESKVVDRKRMLVLTNQITKEVYDNEEEDVREEIRQMREDELAGRAEDMSKIRELFKKDARAEEEIERSPQEMARFLNVLGQVLKSVVDFLGPNTGWCWTIVGGGPDPRKPDAAFSTATFHSGTTQAGLNLAEHSPMVHDVLMVPFSKFLRDVYPLEVQLKRALIKGELSIEADAAVFQAMADEMRPPDLVNTDLSRQEEEAEVVNQEALEKSKKKGKKTSNKSKANREGDAQKPTEGGDATDKTKKGKKGKKGKEGSPPKAAVPPPATPSVDKVINVDETINIDTHEAGPTAPIPDSSFIPPQNTNTTTGNTGVEGGQSINTSTANMAAGGIGSVANPGGGELMGGGGLITNPSGGELMGGGGSATNPGGGELMGGGGSATNPGGGELMGGSGFMTNPGRGDSMGGGGYVMNQGGDDMMNRGGGGMMGRSGGGLMGGGGFVMNQGGGDLMGGGGYMVNAGDDIMYGGGGGMMGGGAYVNGGGGGNWMGDAVGGQLNSDSLISGDRQGGNWMGTTWMGSNWMGTGQSLGGGGNGSIYLPGELERGVYVGHGEQEPQPDGQFMGNAGGSNNWNDFKGATVRGSLMDLLHSDDDGFGGGNEDDFGVGRWRHPMRQFSNDNGALNPSGLLTVQNSTLPGSFQSPPSPSTSNAGRADPNPPQVAPAQSPDDTGSRPNTPPVHNPLPSDEAVQDSLNEPPKTTNEERRKRSVSDTVSTGVAKRQRKATQEVPEWVEEYKTYLLTDIEDPEWRVCVERWCSFEIKAVKRGPGNSRFAASSERPPIIQAWFKKKKLQDPALQDVNEYASGWIKWWKELQPKERAGDPWATEMTPETKNSLICLKKPGTGPGSMLAVVAGLRWWAKAESPEVSWKKAVEAVSGCLDVGRSAPIWNQRCAGPVLQTVAAEIYIKRRQHLVLIDDGLDYTSEDLAANFDAKNSYDFNDHEPLPTPKKERDHHGTRCAGQIAAVKNKACSIGIAYESKVSGIRILAGRITTADEAIALNYGFQDVQLYSCSWGPRDDGTKMQGPSYIIRKAVLNGINKGRGGKGSVFVFASGNGAHHGDQCNFDGYTNSIYSVTVGAVDYKGLHPKYSEPCAAVMVVAYSSGSKNSIVTTDRGKNKCATDHGGTSAAAPNAAGVIALALSVRPDLTWRDVQHLCVQTARQINPHDSDWSKMASGKYYSYKYGFGVLDGWAYVQAAKNWKLVKPQARIETPTIQISNGTMDEHKEFEGGDFIDDGGVSSTILITKEMLAQNNFEKLEHVTVRVWIKHTRRGDVGVYLESPNGIRSVLALPRERDTAKTGFPGWEFMSLKHWGESPVGNWSIHVSDQELESEEGYFLGWNMQLWGECIDPSKAKLYEINKHDDLLPPFRNGSITPARPVIPPHEGDAAPTETHTTLHGKPTDNLPHDSTTPPPPGWLSDLSKAKKNWLMGVVGVIILLNFAGAIYYCRKHFGLWSDDPAATYTALPGGETMPMANITGGRREGQGTGRRLYDVVEEEEGSDGALAARGPPASSAAQRTGNAPGRSTGGVGFHSGFLADDDPLTAGPMAGVVGGARYRDDDGLPPRTAQPVTASAVKGSDTATS